MPSLLKHHLPHVQPLDAGAAALVFSKVFNACDDVSFMEHFLSLMDTSGAHIEPDDVSALILQAHRLNRELYAASVLLCPRIDEGHVENLLRDAAFFQDWQK